MTRPKGYSLIELMVVLVIVALLTLVAWPRFRPLMGKQHQTYAIKVLSERLQAQTRYAQTHQGYTLDLTALAPSAIDDTEFKRHYRLSAQRCPREALDQCVALVAHAKAAGEEDVVMDSLGRSARLHQGQCRPL